MKKIIIIHLSDIHYDGTDKYVTIFDELKKDLIYMLRYVHKYDLLTITGDCINQGNVLLYSQLQNELNALLKTCKVTKKRSIIVAGNHDATKNNIWLKNYTQNHTIENTLSCVEKDPTVMYKEFNLFLKCYSNQNNGIGVKYFNINNAIIRVISLNSSWSTLVNNEYGHLHIGESQLKLITDSIDKQKKKYDITIACMHHPLDWFEYEERVKLQEFLYNKLDIDFLFHGHIHEADYMTYSNLDVSNNTFCTGLSYTKTGEKSSRRDGMRYSIYEIDLSAQTTNVYLRVTNSKYKFVSENRLYSKLNNEGFFSVPIGNISDCLMPIKSIDNKSKIFLKNDTVKLVLEKEDLLFKFYCKMSNIIDTEFAKINDSDIKDYIQKNHNKKLSLESQGLNSVKKLYYKEQFEMFCIYVLTDLNGLFFTNHKHVRFLVRLYDKKTDSHIALMADGIYSSNEDIKKIKSFKWKDGMIYRSYQEKSCLLQSKNLDLHSEGNHNDTWIDYLTITPSGIELVKNGDLIPLLSFNIATDIYENEKCLQALALSSIYDKIQEVFKLFHTKICNLVELYE